MDPNTPGTETERWLGIALKLLAARDFLGSKTFAIRARDSDPNNPVSEQILAVVETVIAGEKRVNSAQHPDWYTVLQLPRLVRDPELISNNYRRLVTLLNPDRNRIPFADYALQLVMDAWSILSDPNKKWLFDNELTVYLQRMVDQHNQLTHQQPPQQQQQQQQPAAAPQINTFQFFQPQPQQQQQSQAAVWQQQQQQQHGGSSSQLHQIEFLQAPMQAAPLLQQPQQLLPQWQMRDPTPVKGGDRNKGVINGNGGGLGMSPSIPIINTPIMQSQTITRPAPVQVQMQTPQGVMPPQFRQPPPLNSQHQTTPLVDGNAGDVGIGNVVSSSSNHANNAANAVHLNNANANANAGDESNKGGGEIEGFWTSCPYCLYVFEYEIVYKECTLRCQNCGRGFHAVQIPTPPPLVNDGDGDKGKDSKDTSFCSWGFFPLGFSMAAWKKQNKMRKANPGSNWVPFSPMFACPVENGSEKFQWFQSSGGGAVGPKNIGKPPASQPRVYFDDVYDEDFNSDPSDSDSSDQDWRRNPATEKKKKKRKRRRGGGFRTPRKFMQGNVNVQRQAHHSYLANHRASAGGRNMENRSNTQNVVVFGLPAGGREDSRKKVASATLTRNQARRRVKNMGRLDLNVELNNEGDEQAPRVSTGNGGEAAVENIEFFEGLDEFLSTLPILNVAGDEKAKPS